MKRGETALTQDQLRLAWQQLRQHGWPDTMEATFADPLNGKRREKCVRGMARQLSRGGVTGKPRYVPPTPAGAPPVPPTPTEPPQRTRPPAAPVTFLTRQRFDARKAAANDLD